MASVGVVGAGAAGLAAAYRLMRLGHDVAVYEAAHRVGGAVRTERRDGFLAEHGPNSMQAPSGAVAQLFRDCGLDQRRIDADPAARKRYVVRGGELRPLPLSPSALLTSSLLSARAKLALAAEPFAPRAPAGDESIAAFVRRRLGREFLDYMADPFVTGIYAGDPEALSMRHALPRIYALEQTYGSVLRAAFKRARKGERPPTLISFGDGLEELPNHLTRALGDRVRLARRVDVVRRDEQMWAVETSSSSGRHDAVVLAAPAHALARLRLEGRHGERIAELTAIPHPAVATLILGFRRADVAHPLDGFGMLIPAAERRRILGVIFSSTVFPGRAPDDHVTLSVFMGGARQPDVAGLDAGQLQEVALAELGKLLGVHGSPVFLAEARWPQAIPQYVLGYDRFLAALDTIEAANPGLRFAGSYRDGVALGDALGSGLDAADALHARLRRHS
ncbi:MAG TPA: protoporphyrinogen oxidase [Gemmatimonadales bacterium]|nr:protoporphyrinogen oxidase [Gemmatimonadales bacterium]